MFPIIQATAIIAALMAGAVSVAVFVVGVRSIAHDYGLAAMFAAVLCLVLTALILACHIDRREGL
jgi:uncharacterized YccA/Bax inhibitor family protein